MNTKRFAIAALATFVFVSVFEGIWHMGVMGDLYEAHSGAFRPKGTGDMTWIYVMEVIYALAATFIFTRNYEAKGLAEGVRFGLMIGVLMATPWIGSYCWMPVPMMIPIMWVNAEILKGLGVGIVLALTYKN